MKEPGELLIIGLHANKGGLVGTCLSDDIAEHRMTLLP